MLIVIVATDSRPDERSLRFLVGWENMAAMTFSPAGGSVQASLLCRIFRIC